MEALQCMYASKPCANPRSFKPNGEPHRLCAFHRSKANDAQRRWHSRQRGAPLQALGDDATSSRKRRRATASKTSASESDVADVPLRRRRRQPKSTEPDVIELAQAALTAPVSLSMLHSGFLPMLQELQQPARPESESFSDEELAQLGECIFGLDDCKVTAATVTTTTPYYPSFPAFEKEMIYASPASSEAFIYCL